MLEVDGFKREGLDAVIELQKGFFWEEEPARLCPSSGQGFWGQRWIPIPTPDPRTVLEPERALRRCGRDGGAAERVKGCRSRRDPAQPLPGAGIPRR